MYKHDVAPLHLSGNVPVEAERLWVFVGVLFSQMLRIGGPQGLRADVLRQIRRATSGTFGCQNFVVAFLNNRNLENY
jgi:hypothetical protein